ncbi:non-hydrolyzing UDP-N-acetylglucosamine 2-epimerase [Brachybacterium saurashtrense]|uniref:UDP-N-acetylglucosamine 2-epimerase (non-hydrolyzing) n=1 Tax=Brachybacterium saurashtrense TaxID=556288 RepID=A0A345YQJ9_9MICO|nr:UDP-N-acetylglucosamine 2-epimerase (non-hydrolyzing) [Brachybacterium saurashtrense]AXK46201.1 UDP-N-acetylglucosamine 2-epimerase (non-hydrolyzing) [Brachybacterium saurashtrense]RRR23941.1 UDP-N-acetylglucosamine 2-epimerase (non-hydrolyzing) [Brachybacterium saurashtrense]
MGLRIMTIYGTRPEAIKVAPIIKAIESADDLESVTVVTGQHREMLDQVNTMFGITPDHDLNIMSNGQSLNGIVAKVISGVDEVLRAEEPDAVIVQGDTSTVMGAAVSAFNRQVPVLHLEAGLRSGDINSPFPEEANRKLTSQIAALHLAPTSTSKANLTREAVSETDIVVTGNSVIDTLMYATENLEVHFEDERLEALQAGKTAGTAGRVLLVTAHRRENLGSAMEDIGAGVAEIARKYPDLTVVFPIHRNPEVRAAIRPAVEGLENVVLTEPLPYAAFTRILSLADIVLTDSGGVQEEAPSLGKPVLVMRENTERPEAVVAGTVKLIGTHSQRLIDEVSLLLDSEEAYAGMANAVNPYGDGAAAGRTVGAIRWKFMGGSRPADFGA